MYEKNKTQKIIKIMGLPIYKKVNIQNGGAVKRKYLGGIFKTVILNNEIKKIYIAGIKVWTKVLPLSISHINRINRRIDDIYFNMQVLVQVPIVHKYFSKYKNCNIGKDVALFAGGPTVQYYDYKNSNVIKCGVNGIIALIDNLDYLFVEDIFINDKNLNEEIDQYKGNNCQKFYGILPQRRVRVLNRNQHFTEKIRPINIYNSKANVFLMEDIYRGKWATDLEVEAFGDFGGAVSSALQFLAYTHPRRIYLVGCDCSKAKLAYHSDRPKDSDNSRKVIQFQSFKAFAEAVYPDIEIISVNPVNLKGIFKDVYTREYLEANPEIKEQLGSDVQILN